MASPPPLVIKVPPAPAGKHTGRLAVIDKWYASHGKNMQKLRSTIEQYASVYGVPEMALAAVIYKESKGANEAAPGSQGWGVAQINIKAPPSAASKVLGRPLTQADAMNPDTAIHILAQSYADSGAGSNVDQFYETVWNPGWKPSPGSFGGTPPSGFAKGTPLYTGKPTPAQKVAGTVATAQAKGQNLAAQENYYKAHVDSIYLAYTGHKATQVELRNYVQNQISDTQLQMNLGNPKLNPALYKSPVWKQNAGLYTKYYQDIFGPGAKPPNSVILHGITYSLDETSFKNELQHDQIKGQQAYAKSEEYQSLFANLKASYASIYGTPDVNGMASIKMAIKGGWTDQQWQNWLRNQPEYKNSNEYKTRSINLAQSMGLLTGGEAQNVLASAVAQQVPGGAAEAQPSPPATVSVTPKKPTATPPATVTPPPQLISEHGQGGGSG